MSSVELQHHESDVPFPLKKPIKCISSSKKADSSDLPLIFTHGASGTLTSDAVLNFRNGFARIRPITCFQGNMNLGSRVKMFDAVLSGQPTTALGGRSMGARAAILAAKERDDIKHLVLVSYPLHTGKDVRDKILLEIEEDVKVLFMIGDGDELCQLSRLDEVRGKMQARTWMVIVKGADHGMKIQPKKGTSGVGELTGEVAAKWLLESDENKTTGRIWWNQDDEGSATWSGWEAEVGHEKKGRKRKQEAKELTKGSDTKVKRRRK